MGPPLKMLGVMNLFRSVFFIQLSKIYFGKNVFLKLWYSHF
ncbi:hypothetical protein BGP_4362 [Beggiatoa sp. PS]|nr:hypothetical protein BGP_4362 [Beggiatoa sp. PS]